MDVNENKCTDTSVLNFTEFQDVFRDTVKIETDIVPFPNNIRIFHNKFLKDGIKENWYDSYIIMNIMTGKVIYKMNRSEDKYPAFFIYVPFKGKEYIITSSESGVFTIINCNGEDHQYRTLSIDDCKVYPIKASARISTDLKGCDVSITLTFLCELIKENLSSEYKNITTTIDNLDEFKFPSRIDTEKAEIDDL